MVKTTLLLGLGWLWGSQCVQAADFDCKRASSLSEKAICTNHSLSDADVKLATSYHLLTPMLAMGSRGDVQDSQRAWLKQRDACGKNTACLQGMYSQRQQQLDRYWANIYSRGPY